MRYVTFVTPMSRPSPSISIYCPSILFLDIISSSQLCQLAPQSLNNYQPTHPNIILTLNINTNTISPGRTHASPRIPSPLRPTTLQRPRRLLQDSLARRRHGRHVRRSDTTRATRRAQRSDHVWRLRRRAERSRHWRRAALTKPK